MIFKNTILLTKRLTLRSFKFEDLNLLYSLHSNAEVGKTTIDGIQNLESVQEHLKNFITHQEKSGYSQWAVFENHSNNFIGRAGLTKRSLNQEILEQVELRFALLPEFWGLGYAQELTQSIIKLGFEKLKLKTIVATHGIKNEKSAHILKKNGFKYIKNIIPEGYGTKDEIKYYILENSNS